MLYNVGETSWCKDATLVALKAGYRHLDCAWDYGVNKEIGDAIRESGIPRSEIFITTKFSPEFSHPENVELCLDLCLKQMDLDYVDLFLAHWAFAAHPISRAGLENAKTGPEFSLTDRGMATAENGMPVIDWEHCTENIAKLAGKKGSFVPTWKAMQSLVSTGKARAIGVSNFSISELKELLPHSKEIPISCCQNEIHPWLPATERVAFMRQQGIIPVCFSPFAGQKRGGETLLKDETVLKLAKKNGTDVGQLLQSWAVGRGTIPLGKSQTECNFFFSVEV